MTLDGGGVKAGDFADTPTRVAYALLDMGGKASVICCCCCCFERLNSQKRVLFVLVVLAGGLIRSMGLLDR
jgi:multidrug transporter EmrE-like cation transporter